MATPNLLHPIPEGLHGYGYQVHCPICGFEYVHTGRPETISPEDSGTRSGGLRLRFSCENGHEFAIDFGEHKGNTFARVLQRIERFLVIRTSMAAPTGGDGR
jgi:hypothetical protein